VVGRRLAIAHVFLVGIAAAAQAQLPAGDVQVLAVQGNVYMLVGPTANATVQIGSDGALVVDTMTAALAPAILEQIRRLTPGPLRYIIDTSIDPDHIGGNAVLAKAGVSPAPGGGATVIAHEQIVNRLAPPVTSANPTPAPAELPNSEYYTPFRDFYYNGEPVVVVHEPNAHTDGDSLVWFRRSDVLSVGDLFTPDRYPVIDIEKGGSVQGVLVALNHIIDITVPERLQDGGTRVIPGHGRLCNEADVVEYRDMVTIVRDRVQDLVKQGMTLEQVRAAGPTRDYDTRYGSGDRFVDAVYRSLIHR
jgi:glyoxylase-like metal-dependent hydrolase (beta-lactamase superfamily II)